MNNINIKKDENVVEIKPLPSENNDIEQDSIDNCVKIAKINSLNRQLYNNCYNVQCGIANDCMSKCISNGSCSASIMFVDALPSEYETFTGAFTDEKGYLLEDAIKNTKVKRSDIYCTTLIKCFELSNVNSTIIENCLLNYFSKEFDIIRPKKIFLTYSAFQACLKYNVIEGIGNISYFSKNHIKFNLNKIPIETDLYIVYDIKALNDLQRASFKQGIQTILNN